MSTAPQQQVENPTKPPVENDKADVTEHQDGVDVANNKNTYTPEHWSNIGFISRYLTYYFVSPLVSWASDKKEDVQMEHLWDVPETDRVAVLVEQFDAVREQDPNRGYYKPLFSVGKRLILIGAFFLLLKTLIEVFIPVIVREIIDHVARKDFNGIYYVIAFFGMSLVGQFSNQVHLRMMEVAANRLRGVSNYVIFRHAMKLRACAFGDGLSDIVTLVASDTQRFVDVYAHVHLIWASPVQIILGTYYLVQFISYPGFVAVGIMLALYPYSMALSSVQAGVRRKLLPLTQQRVLQISEFLQGVRVVKMYGWEPFLLNVVQATRAKELACLTKELLLWMGSTSFLITIPQFALCFTFIIYINTEGSLSAANAFASLSMLSLLKFPVLYFGNAIMIGMQAKVGCERIQAFLNKDNVVMRITATAKQPMEDYEKEPNGQEPEAVSKTDIEGDEDLLVEVANCDFTWSGKDGETRAHQLIENRSPIIDHNEPFPSANAAPEATEGKEMTEVAVKKEEEEGVNNIAIFALKNLTIKLKKGECCAILGPVGSGKTMATMSLLQETYQNSGFLRVPQTVAYAAQEPYLMSGTVRDNILFFREFDEVRYRRALEACQLWQDLDAYTDGEMTIVGERGITLSGGQKARIALARAVYASEAELVILDDPFSALDARTGKLVLEALLSRPDGLLRNQAVVMVTHARGNLWAADHVLELSHGDIAVSPSSPSAEACYGEPEPPADEIKDEEEEDDESKKKDNSKRELASTSKNKLVKAEHKEGTVAFRTYFDFFIWGGGAIFVLGTFGGICVERLAFASSDVWLSIWTSAEKGEPTHEIGQKYDFPRGDHFDGARFYLRVYAVIVVITHCLGLLRLGSFAAGGLTSAKRLFAASFERLSRCPMSFFDSTPTGRILNRMSHDVERIGYPLITQLNAMYATTGWLFTGLIVTAAVVPYNLLLLVPAIGLVFYTLLRFRAVNVHLQRLDAIARSNLQSHIFESITGAVTIRSFGRANDFLSRCRDLVDENTRSLYAVAMCQRWVAMRAEFLAALMMSFVCLMVWVMRDSIDGGLAGMAIVWSMNGARSITFAITEGVQGEAKLVSIERLVDYVENLPEEPARVIEETQPSPEWPEDGRIEFKNVCMRYREGLPLVLNDCNFSIKAGSRVGIVGRTGSGKSSTIVAMFRLRELVSGGIFIDDVEIGTIGLDGLRGGRMSIIPQDPVLFSGTTRSNVDPFNQYEDDDVIQALTAVQLWDYVSTIGGLDAVVEERGRNFSVGQRQLICIARALLRRPRILLMDEATANVDNDTDLLIQRAVRDLFKDTTVVEIAHRLHTVMDADNVIVMADGSVVETGTPHELCEANGTFASMVRATGETTAAELRSIAKSVFDGVDPHQ